MRRRRRLINQWFRIREYFSTSTIYPRYVKDVNHFETLLKSWYDSILPTVTLIIYRRRSGQWTYNSDTGLLVLYRSPFDVVLKNNGNSGQILLSSALWMNKFIEKKFIMAIQQEKPILRVIDEDDEYSSTTV